MAASNFSLEPDESMRWIYDPSHPAYHDEATRDLRDRRAAALRSCPQWMLDEAALNDALKRAATSPRTCGVAPCDAAQRERMSAAIRKHFPYSAGSSHDELVTDFLTAAGVGASDSDTLRTRETHER